MLTVFLLDLLVYFEFYLQLQMCQLLNNFSIGMWASDIIFKLLKAVSACSKSKVEIKIIIIITEEIVVFTFSFKYVFFLQL